MKEKEEIKLTEEGTLYIIGIFPNVNINVFDDFSIKELFSILKIGCESSKMILTEQLTKDKLDIHNNVLGIVISLSFVLENTKSFNLTNDFPIFTDFSFENIKEQLPSSLRLSGISNTFI